MRTIRTAKGTLHDGAGSRIRGGGKQQTASTFGVLFTDARIGVSASFYMAVNRKSTPRRRGPAFILGIDEAGGTRKFQIPTCTVGMMGGNDVNELECNPPSGILDSCDGAPMEDLEHVRKHAEFPLGGGAVSQMHQKQTCHRQAPRRT